VMMLSGKVNFFMFGLQNSFEVLRFKERHGSIRQNFKATEILTLFLLTWRRGLLKV
jgi:hypothetical protein